LCNGLIFVGYLSIFGKRIGVTNASTFRLREKQEERGSCKTLVRQEAYFYQLVQFQSV